MCYHCRLDPDNDPLCVLLMIDYFALRAGEYKFLTRLCEEWEVLAILCTQIISRALIFEDFKILLDFKSFILVFVKSQQLRDGI